MHQCVIIVIIIRKRKETPRYLFVVDITWEQKRISLIRHQKWKVVQEYEERLRKGENCNQKQLALLVRN